MSRITINENENNSFASFDVTENTVLVPILYARSASFKQDENGYVMKEVGSQKYFQVEFNGAVPSTTRYTNITDFESTMRIGSVTVDGLLDKSYIMAHNLISRGLTVVVKPIEYTVELDESELLWTAPEGQPEADPVPTDEQNALLNTLNTATEVEVRNTLRAAFANAEFKEFEDKNVWNIKFVTTGGYHNVESELLDDETDTKLATYIAQLAAKREDCIALIEFPKDLGTKDAEIINEINKYTAQNEYCASFFPWGIHSGLSIGDDLTEMPACFSYLLAFANSIRSNADWFAASGATRGYVPTLKYPYYEVGEALMHILQGEEQFALTTADDTIMYTTLACRVNPIMNTGVYGYRVWGNRVMLPISSDVQNYSYRDFLNVRVLLCDLKKQIYHSSMRVMFEPNDDIAWFNFKALVNPLLEKMQSGRGVEYYIWKKLRATNKATLSANLTIKPIEGIEYININIDLTDADVELVEEA